MLPSGRGRCPQKNTYSSRRPVRASSTTSSTLRGISSTPGSMPPPSDIFGPPRDQYISLNLYKRTGSKKQKVSQAIDRFITADRRHGGADPSKSQPSKSQPSKSQPPKAN